MAYDDRRSSTAPRPLPPLPPHRTRGPQPDWLLFPREVLAMILLKLGAVEIIESAQKLRRLRLVHCLEVSNEGLSRAATKLPLLETFENYYSYLSERSLVAIGQNCPHLTTLKFIKDRSRRRRKDMDKEAIAIAKYMRGLRHLTLIGNKLTNRGLKAILDGCSHLEMLDLRQSYNVDLRGEIAKQCGLINNLRHPVDPFDGYGSDAIIKNDYEAYSDNSMSSYDSSDYTYCSPPPPPPRHWTPRGPKPNWLELPRAVLTDILLKLGAIEIIESAQKVCTQWRSACMDPTMWTHIDMNPRDLYYKHYDLVKMCRHVIDRSCGGCVDINMMYFCDDQLLNYIIASGCQLRRLRLVCCLSVSDEGMAEAAPSLTFLETFEYYKGNLAENALKAIGKNCPRLTTLRYEHEGCKPYGREMDDEAFAIAKYMPGLRRLSLVGTMVTDMGLGAILDGCPHLESLDLRQCFNLMLKGDDLAKKCKRIKELKWPGDSTSGYKFSENIMRFDCLDDSSDYSDYNPGSNSEDHSLDDAYVTNSLYW